MPKEVRPFIVVNIGIDLIINLQILHNNGYVHRDIKPDNLAFGPLCLENLKYKNRISILDFGKTKIFHKKNGALNFSNGKKGCFGNKSFSSNNALLEKDVLPFDDIESIFYLMIYFLNGSLPWERSKLSEENYNKKNIIEIRKNISPEELCKNFPKKFINLFKETIYRLPTQEPVWKN